MFSCKVWLFGSSQQSRQSQHGNEGYSTPCMQTLCTQMYCNDFDTSLQLLTKAML